MNDRYSFHLTQRLIPQHLKKTGQAKCALKWTKNLNKFHLSASVAPVSHYLGPFGRNIWQFMNLIGLQFLSCFITFIFLYESQRKRFYDYREEILQQKGCGLQKDYSMLIHFVIKLTMTVTDLDAVCIVIA